jgi:hypothetical protein
MIPKSGHRFSDQIMRKTNDLARKSAKRFSDPAMPLEARMIPKSGHRSSDQIMRSLE